MKLKELLRSPKVFKIITIILFGICFIMLGLYFFNANTSEFSKNSNEWANFGQYFGSITGLLAFAGVLYSAALSEEKAKKADERAKVAEDESKAREERDQFFKLLELLQKKIESFEIEEYKGIRAFKKIGEDANKCLISYTTLKEALDRNFADDGYDIDEKIIFLRYKTAILGGINYVDKLGYLRKSIDEFNFDLLLKMSRNSEEYFNDIIMSQNINIDRQYQYLKYVGTLILRKYGFILEPYLNNFYYLISSLYNFKSVNDFNKLITTQISRYESLIIFYCAVSNKSDYRNISNLQGTLIFRNINPDDYLLYNGSRETVPDLDGIIHFVLSKCLEDIREYYIKDFGFTFPHK